MAVKPPLVVVVDDEASICRALLRLLRTANLRAEAFCAARDFLEFLRHQTPDCVILDLQMPHMSGMEVLERLQYFATPPPVIVITAFDQPGVRERCVELGIVCYLRKPVDSDKLLRSVHAAVAGGDA